MRPGNHSNVMLGHIYAKAASKTYRSYCAMDCWKSVSKNVRAAGCRKLARRLAHEKI